MKYRKTITEKSTEEAEDHSKKKEPGYTIIEIETEKFHAKPECITIEIEEIKSEPILVDVTPASIKMSEKTRSINAVVVYVGN